jgi:diguanylate cyclase (GGDEF)-like protein
MEREKSTILIVDDNPVNRQLLRRILFLDYFTLEAENGQEALEILERTERISAVLLDIVMPVMDGYAFLEALQKTAQSTIPVIAITGESDVSAEQKALNLGAWDFVSKPYQPTTLRTRLKNVIVRSQYYLMSEMRHAYEHDQLTNLYNRTTFFIETRRLLDDNPDTRFALIRFDIDRFQTYNAFWGEEEGDRLLIYIANSLRKIAEILKPCTYGRINADAFCICVPFDAAKLGPQVEQACAKLEAFNPEYRIEPSFGIYVIEDPHEKIQTMYEFAMLAARQCKGSCLRHVCYYEHKLGVKTMEEQRIVNEMQAALDSGQFEVYLQPKYNLQTEQPYGAEALIRWRHPERGLLSPGLFIPVFERNGFVGKVDAYMWEEVCRLLRGWRDAGQNPGPISVNVSRVNMYNPNLVEVLTGLVRKYDIPSNLLHLELTESAYMENPEIMSNTVRALQQAGFKILMDDFGSGYSSLNTLKEIPVDVLKIDMKFLSGNADAARGRCILASVIRMAGWLSTPVIMEGVETVQQKDLLKSIGCGYVQGFYFARPMPVREYESLIFGVPQMPTQAVGENLQEIAEILWSPSPEVDFLFESLEQPAAVYEWESGHVHALRVNDSFLSLFGYGVGIDSTRQGSFGAFLSPEDLQGLLRAFEEAAESRSGGVFHFTQRLEDGTCRNLRVSLKYWGKNEAAKIIFAQFSVLSCN